MIEAPLTSPTSKRSIRVFDDLDITHRNEAVIIPPTPPPQLVLQLLWKRIAISMKENDMLAAIASEHIHQRCNDRGDVLTALSSTSIQCHVHWLEGRVPLAIQQYKETGNVCALASASLICFDLLTVMDLLRDTHNKSLMRMLANCIAEYVRDQDVRVVAPTCFDGNENDINVCVDTARVVVLNSTRLRLALETHHIIWNCEKAVQLFLASDLVMDAICLLHDTGQIQQAMSLAVQCNSSDAIVFIRSCIRECMNKHQYNDLAVLLQIADGKGIDVKELRHDCLQSCVLNIRQILASLPLLPTQIPHVTMRSPIHDIETFATAAWTVASDIVSFLRSYTEYLSEQSLPLSDHMRIMDTKEMQQLRLLCRLLWCKREYDQMTRAFLVSSEDTLRRAIRMLQFCMFAINAFLCDMTR